MILILTCMLLGAAADAEQRISNGESNTAHIVELHVVTRASISAGEPQTELQLDEQTLSWKTNELLQPLPRHDARGAFVLAYAEVELWRRLLLRGLLDSGELRAGNSYDPAVETAVASDGRPLGEAARSTGFVRELEAATYFGPVDLGIGRRRHSLAQGLVYDDYSTGAFGSVDLQKLIDVPVRLRGSASLLGPLLELHLQSSALIYAEVAYDVSLFENISLFAATLFDRDGTLDSLLQSAIAERKVINEASDLQLLLPAISDRHSDGYIDYWGAAWELLPIAGMRLRGAAVISRGEMNVPWGPERTLGGPDTYYLRLQSWAAFVETSYGLAPNLGIGAFAFGLSGDAPPREAADGHSSYGAFLGVAPFWTWTNLFFSGGLSQGFYAGRAMAAGVLGHGVTGAGGKVELMRDRWFAELRLAYLRALAAPPPEPMGGQGTAYGVELDLYGEWRVWDGVLLGGEIDLLRPGSFFVEQQLVYRVVALLQISWDTHAR